MGADKEATDIWVFGKPRPDLSPEQTFAASQEAHKSPPELEPEERERREHLIGEIIKRRTNDMAIGVGIGLRAAKAKAAATDETPPAA